MLDVVLVASLSFPLFSFSPLPPSPSPFHFHALSGSVSVFERISIIWLKFIRNDIWWFRAGSEGHIYVNGMQYSNASPHRLPGGGEIRNSWRAHSKTDTDCYLNRFPSVSFGMDDDSILYIGYFEEVLVAMVSTTKSECACFFFVRSSGPGIEICRWIGRWRRHGNAIDLIDFWGAED